MKPEPQPGKASQLLSLARSFMQSRIFLSAVELGIMDCLSKGACRASQIARALDTDERATEILLDALTAMTILVKTNHHYALHPDIGSALHSDNAQSVGAKIRHACQLWEPWAQLSRVVKEGSGAITAWGAKNGLQLDSAMRQHATIDAPQIAALLATASANSMLDLGAGHGSYGIALANSMPHLRVVLLDRDRQVLDRARVEIDSSGLRDRICIRRADFLTDAIGCGFDLVLISSVLCLLSQAQIRQVLQRVWRALKPGGRIVIRDLMLDDTKTSPPAAAIFSVGMLVSTSAGRVYTTAELRNWLDASGFENVHRIPMATLPMMIGTSPVDALNGR